MKHQLILFFLSVSFLSIGQTRVTQKLGDFTELKVYNGIELELIPSTEQRVEITGKKSEEVSIKNVNGVLKFLLPFSLTPKSNVASDEVLVKLYFNNNLTVIDANEGSLITGKDINQTNLEVKVQEKAFINLVVKTTNLFVRASSGGTVKLSGTTENQSVDLDLYGIYEGFNLKAKNKTEVKAGSGARAEVNTGSLLSAKVSFGGSIFYKGDPEIIKDKKVIGGTIQKRN